ncbi:hypothetical protein [Streptomyces camelliae]|uniref:Integrase catalytic domain-containing protein n=1 Tax=Streptomyces camelliae TaxID=3004093 RepID=A0ABY7NU16_9ACTN|nr:hypothetical protein [Streptomyces sp. HUAS 2-6]WBO61734.1 hypothetical protein O1G22_02115 [Streptomyces sp. HUAS 2-6]
MRLPVRPERGDARWCGDFIYVPTDGGRLCLATVNDIATRRGQAGRPPATRAPSRSSRRCGPPAAADAASGPVIFHSALGCRYTDREFATLEAELEIRLAEPL